MRARLDVSIGLVAGILVAFVGHHVLKVAHQSRGHRRQRPAVARGVSVAVVAHGVPLHAVRAVLAHLVNGGVDVARHNNALAAANAEVAVVCHRDGLIFKSIELLR